MDLSLLDILRVEIATAKDLTDAFDFFFDHFGDDPAFMDVGELTDDPLLLQLLGQIGGSFFKTNKVRLDNLRLVSIKERHFIHGGMTMNGAMANVIYFADTKQGLLALFQPAANPPVQMVRFSAEMIAPNLTTEATQFKQ